MGPGHDSADDQALGWAASSRARTRRPGTALPPEAIVLIPLQGREGLRDLELPVQRLAVELDVGQPDVPGRRSGRPAGPSNGGS